MPHEMRMRVLEGPSRSLTGYPVECAHFFLACWGSDTNVYMRYF